MIERRIIMLDQLRERVVGEVTQRDVTVFGTRHKKVDKFNQNNE